MDDQIAKYQQIGYRVEARTATTVYLVKRLWFWRYRTVTLTLREDGVLVSD